MFNPTLAVFVAKTKYIANFHTTNHVRSRWRNRLIRQLRAWPDGSRLCRVSQNKSLIIPRMIRIFIVAIRNRSDLEISRRKLHSQYVEEPKQAENSRTCAPNLVPKLAHNFIAIFHISNYLGSQWPNRLVPLLRVSCDLTVRRWAGSNPGQVKNNCYRAFPLIWPASILIYWNKRKFLPNKKVQFPQGCISTPTCVAAVSLFWNTNMAAVTSCENALLLPRIK